MLYFNSPQKVAATINQRYGFIYDRNFFSAEFFKMFSMRLFPIVLKINYVFYQSIIEQISAVEQKAPSFS
ncbi:MAG: hypothetical protein BroJett041_25830 [Candidatus Jettenia caeni]|nr:MAG: hypothetical protein BroJett041_25830 [Candidatus Jettenia caeni]